jgi:protein SCO1
MRITDFPSTVPAISAPQTPDAERQTPNGYLLPVARALLLPVLCLLGLLIYSGSGDRFSYAGTPVRSGVTPPLVLSDDHGGMFDLAKHRGEIVLVYFGYTHCPDVCPATLNLVDAVSESLGAEQHRVKEVFVTLDPVRDTPELLRTYLSNFDSAAIGLTGSPEAVAAAARAWSVTWRRARGGVFIDHTSIVTLVGPDGRERLRYGFSQLSNSAAVARDIEHILHEPVPRPAFGAPPPS